MAYRIHYQERLAQIRASVIQMGGQANDMVRLAVEAAQTGNVELANQVMAADDQVDEMERHTLQETVLIVMQETPVASDLRMLVSTIGVIGEIEKVGDDAVKMARRAAKLAGRFPAELKLALFEMGEMVRHSFAGAIRLYSEYSPALADEIIRGDKAIDERYNQVRGQVFELIREQPDEIKRLVRSIEVFHALEHVADHAVAIAVRLRMHYSAPAAQPAAS